MKTSRTCQRNIYHSGSGNFCFRFEFAALFLCLLLSSFTGSAKKETTRQGQTETYISVFEESFSKDLSQFGYNDELKKANRAWGDKKWLSEGAITLKNSRTEPGTFSGVIIKLQIPYLQLENGKISFDFKQEKQASFSVYVRNNKEKRSALIFNIDGNSKISIDTLKDGVAKQLETANIPGTIKEDSWNTFGATFSGKNCTASLNGHPIISSDKAPEGFGGIMVFLTENNKALELKNLKVWSENGSRYTPHQNPDDSPKEKIITDFPDVPKTLPEKLFYPYNTEFKRKGKNLSGVLVGPLGKKHKWELAEDKLVFDGNRIIPIAGGDGEFFAEYREDFSTPPADKVAMERIKKYGLTVMPLILCPSNFIDCSIDGNGYRSDPVIDGGSRILEINGRKYRVSSCRDEELSYFSYTFDTDKPRKPHIMIAELPNDRERYTVFRIQPPPGYLSNYMYNIGNGTYTGRNMPCDGKEIYQYMLFYPRSKKVRFSVSRLNKELGFHPDNGAAVSRIWIYTLKEATWQTPNVFISYPAKTRTMGITMTGPAQIYRNRSGFCRGNSKIEEKENDLYAFLQYLNFSGINNMLIYVIDGNDATTKTYYSASKYLPGKDMHFFSKLFPAASGFRISVIPGMPSLICHPNLKVKKSIPDDAYLIDNKGKRITWIWPNLDPIHPVSNSIQIGILREICERAKNIKGIKGISLRVYAAIGSCFSKGPIWINRNGSESGYSRWDISLYKKETGSDVPADDSFKAYKWLKKNEWEKWISWRCKKMKECWIEARDMIKSYNKDWDFIVRIVLPNKKGDKYQLWKKENISIKELYRYYGFDPDLFANENGFNFITTYEMGTTRHLFHHYQTREKASAVEEFSTSPELQSIYSKLDSGFEVYIHYWEEHGALLGSSLFAGRWPPHWGAATVTPGGRYFFKPIIGTILNSNSQDIYLLSWEGGTNGHEQSLRRFSRAFQALPIAEPLPFKGKISTANPENIHCHWQGDRLRVMNNSAEPQNVHLSYNTDLKKGQKLIEAGSGAVLFEAEKDGVQKVDLLIIMDAYDLAAVCKK